MLYTMLHTLLMHTIKVKLISLKGVQCTIGHQRYNVILYMYVMYKVGQVLLDIMTGSLYSSSAVFKQCMKVLKAFGW